MTPEVGDVPGAPVLWELRTRPSSGPAGRPAPMSAGQEESSRDRGPWQHGVTHPHTDTAGSRSCRWPCTGHTPSAGYFDVCGSLLLWFRFPVTMAHSPPPPPSLWHWRTLSCPQLQSFWQARVPREGRRWPAGPLPSAGCVRKLMERRRGDWWPLSGCVPREPWLWSICSAQGHTDGLHVCPLRRGKGRGPRQPHS